MKPAIYSLLVVTAAFEMIMQVYSMPFDPTETPPRSPYASYVRPDQVYLRDKPQATTLPIGRYTPRPNPQVIFNQNHQNKESIEAKEKEANEKEAKGKVDEITNKIRSQLQNEMAKTRSQIKLKREHFREAMDMFMNRTRNGLQQISQFEAEELINEMAEKMSSLRSQRSFIVDGLQSTIRQLHRLASDQMHQMRVDFAKDIRSSREMLANLDASFPAFVKTVGENMKYQNDVRMEKIRNQFHDIVKELGVKFEQNHSQIFGLVKQNKQNILSQINDDLRKEVEENGKVIEKEIRDMFAQGKQSLQDAYSKAQPLDEVSAKEYMKQELNDVTKKMKEIKEEMELKMDDEIRRVIDTLRTEVGLIMSDANNESTKKDIQTSNELVKPNQNMAEVFKDSAIKNRTW